MDDKTSFEVVDWPRKIHMCSPRHSLIAVSSQLYIHFFFIFLFKFSFWYFFLYIYLRASGVRAWRGRLKGKRLKTLLLKVKVENICHLFLSTRCRVLQECVTRYDVTPRGTERERLRVDGGRGCPGDSVLCFTSPWK